MSRSLRSTTSSSDRPSSTYSLPMSKIETYRQHQPSDLEVDQVLATFYLFLNVTKPPFDNLKLRQALIHVLAADVEDRDLPPAPAVGPRGRPGARDFLPIPECHEASVRQPQAPTGPHPRTRCRCRRSRPTASTSRRTSRSTRCSRLSTYS